MTTRSTRRSFFRTLGAAGAAGVTIGARETIAGPTRTDTASARDDAPVLQVGENVAVAETKHGRSPELVRRRTTSKRSEVGLTTSTHD